MTEITEIPTNTTEVLGQERIEYGVNSKLTIHSIPETPHLSTEKRSQLPEKISKLLTNLHSSDHKIIPRSIPKDILESGQNPLLNPTYLAQSLTPPNRLRQNTPPNKYMKRLEDKALHSIEQELPLQIKIKLPANFSPLKLIEGKPNVPGYHEFHLLKQASSFLKQFSNQKISPHRHKYRYPHGVQTSIEIDDAGSSWIWESMLNSEEIQIAQQQYTKQLTHIIHNTLPNTNNHPLHISFTSEDPKYIESLEQKHKQLEKIWIEALIIYDKQIKQDHYPYNNWQEVLSAEKKYRDGIYGKLSFLGNEEHNAKKALSSQLAIEQIDCGLKTLTPYAIDVSTDIVESTLHPIISNSSHRFHSNLGDITPIPLGGKWQTYEVASKIVFRELASELVKNENTKSDEKSNVVLSSGSKLSVDIFEPFHLTINPYKNNIYLPQEPGEQFLYIQEDNLRDNNLEMKMARNFKWIKPSGTVEFTDSGRRYSIPYVPAQ